jgi:hypothetical protein
MYIKLMYCCTQATSNKFDRFDNIVFFAGNFCSLVGMRACAVATFVPIDGRLHGFEAGSILRIEHPNAQGFCLLLFLCACVCAYVTLRLILLLHSTWIR